MVKQTVRRFFAGGITSKGFVEFYRSSLQDLNRVFILKGGPGTGKSKLIQAISDRIADEVPERWHLQSAKDPDTLDGIVIPGVAAVVDGDAPHVIEPKLPGAVETIVNLGDAWDVSALVAKKSEIANIRGEVEQSFVNAFNHFKDALRVHDEWESIYIDSMDFEEANKLTNELSDLFFAGKSLSKTSRIDHRYLGAATPEGAIDFIPNLTEDVEKRYFIKGRPGCGKSTMLKKLAKDAEARGFDIEIYHCGFDPDSLDMLVFRELGVAIFDSTSPHEHFPSREGDEVIDMYVRCMEPDVDERNAEAIARVSKQYKDHMKAATGYLAQAREDHRRLKAIYGSAMDFAKVEQMTDQILEEVKRLLKK